MSSTFRFKCRIFLEKQHQFRVKSPETAKMNKTFKTHLERFSKKVPLSYFNKKGLNEFIDYLRFTAELGETESDDDLHITIPIHHFFESFNIF